MSNTTPLTSLLLQVPWTLGVTSTSYTGAEEILGMVWQLRVKKKKKKQKQQKHP